MRCRGVHGTTEGHYNSIILYVPDSTCQISYGFYILGKGTAWMVDVKFDFTLDSLALTDLIKGDFSCRIPGFKPAQNAKKEPYDTGFEN